MPCDWNNPNSLPNNKILDTFKFKVFEDNNMKFDEMAEYSPKDRNTAGIREIACYEQFFPFPTLFLKDMYCRHVKNQGFLGKRVENTM